ncbi:MAG: hypothetical protein COB51_07530 [Moraxellaceae bacterium]|nr:MAG: hypothetical protein COB51_07530 [Moraxellaceae bacterium]
MENDKPTPARTIGPVGLFRKGITDPQRLLGTTVGRESLLEETLSKLHRTAHKNSAQHFLFIGPRGIGKTHLMTMIEEKVSKDNKLQSRYHVLSFPEENHRILSFADLLLGIIDLLANIDSNSSDESDVLEEKNAKADSVETDRWQTLYDTLSEEEDDQKIIDTIEPRLKAYCKKTNKKLLILLENLGTLLGEQLKKKQDIHHFRTFLMGATHIQLLATSTSFFAAITDVGQPLFDFFDIQVIDDLSLAQTLELVRKNLEWDGQTELLGQFSALTPKIQALHTMTGGNPRLITMLYQLIAADQVLDVKLNFQKLLDQISPFYQDRINDLPPQERAVLETIALMPGDLKKTPANIAKRIRKSPQQTSSLLKRMTKTGYLLVIDNPQDKRSKLYRIKEGFFDIWLAMSESRSKRKRLPFIVDFLAHWYPSQQERENKRKEMARQLEETSNIASIAENSREMMDYLSDIGSDSERTQTKLSLAVQEVFRGSIDDSKRLLKETKTLQFNSPQFIWMQQQVNQLVEDRLPIDNRQRIEQMIEYWQTQRSGDLEKTAILAAELGFDFSEAGLHKLSISLLIETIPQVDNTLVKLELLEQLADSQFIDGQLVNAEKTAKQIIHTSQDIENMTWAVKGNILMGKIYFQKGQFDTSLNYFNQSLALAQEAGNREQEGAALNNISQIFKAQGDNDKALGHLEQSLVIRQEIGDRFGEGATLNNISGIFNARGDYDKALRYLEQSLEILQEIGDRSGEGTTLNNISQIYDARGDSNKALEYLEQSLGIKQEIGDRSGEGTALNNISQIYDARGDCDKALGYLEQSLVIRQEIGDVSGLCATLFNMGHIYLQNNEFKKAIATWLKVYEQAKEIKLAQALEALEGLAEGLGLSGGLQGWEELLIHSKNDS